MEDCHHVLAVEPDNAQAHGVLGRVLQCEGQFEEAIVACTRAIELGDENAPVYLSRAISYAYTNQFTFINLGFEYGKRGNNTNLLRENMFRITVGFTLSDLWFIKKKYN